MSKGRRRVRDRWKSKGWFTILAPSFFGEKEIGITPADDPSKVLNRVLESALFNLTGDPSHLYLDLYFQIRKLSENKAYTIFKGHEYLRDYIRSLIRRRSTKVDCICNVETSDNLKLRVTAMVLTSHRINSSQASFIRKIAFSILQERAKSLPASEFIPKMLYGDLANEIVNEAKKICPIQCALIAKSKLLSIPTN